MCSLLFAVLWISVYMSLVGIIPQSVWMQVCLHSLPSFAATDVYFHLEL